MLSIPNLIQRIPPSWTILITLGFITALYSFLRPKVRLWRERREREGRQKRFQKTLQEVEVESAAAAALKKKRKLAGTGTGTGEAMLTPKTAAAAAASASPKKTPSSLPPSTPTPSSKKQSISRPRAPSNTNPNTPLAPRKLETPPIDTSDFEPVVPKHKMKNARRVSSAAASASTAAAVALQVPSGGESSAASSNGDDARKELAETTLIISKLRVEIGVAKAQEGKARSEAETARENEDWVKEEMEALKRDHEVRIQQAQKKEASVHHRLHSLSNQYAQLVQRHQALEIAFHDMARRISPMPSPHLGQNHIPVYPIAVSMPSPIPMRHPSYGYPSPMAQPYLQPPPQYRRPSASGLVGPHSPHSMSPAGSLPSSSDHELKKNVEWSVLKRNPDRTASGSESTADSTRASSEAGLEGDQPGAPIHGLGMGDLMETQGSTVQSPTTTVATPPPEVERDQSPVPDPQPDFFPPVFPCVSHTREQLAELALLQKNAAAAAVQQKRKDSSGPLRTGELPMTPSPSASPSIKGLSTADLLAVEGDGHSEAIDT